MSRITSEDFVVIWATSKTLDDVVQSSKMTKPAVTARAKMLRNLGVKLPKLSKPTGYDQLRIAQLNSLLLKHDIRRK